MDVNESSNRDAHFELVRLESPVKHSHIDISATARPIDTKLARPLAVINAVLAFRY